MGLIKGLLFDKDGTLFHFGATWNSWSAAFIASLAEGPQAEALADAMQFDLAKGEFARSSPIIAGTLEAILDAVLSVMPELDRGWLDAELRRSTSAAPQVPATPLAPLLAGFISGGYRLGLATNDAEEPAHVQLTHAGIIEQFEFIAGYDSGHGAKPGPGMALAFCAHTGLAPHQVAMIGDSTHDLISARAAGTRAIGVLTGMASHDDLGPHADIVLNSIADLPEWLADEATRARPQS